MLKKDYIKLKNVLKKELYILCINTDLWCPLQRRWNKLENDSSCMINCKKFCFCTRPPKFLFLFLLSFSFFLFHWSFVITLRKAFGVKLLARGFGIFCIRQRWLSEVRLIHKNQSDFMRSKIHSSFRRLMHSFITGSYSCKKRKPRSVLTCALTAERDGGMKDRPNMSWKRSRKMI